jgi:hypothetical protein
LNLGNISSNGHPNGGRSRQLYCCGCGADNCTVVGVKVTLPKRRGPCFMANAMEQN